MLKNKNIAKAMAATTLLTAAAPTAFAAQSRAIIENAQENEVKELKEKVYDLLNTRYTSNDALLQNAEAGSQVYDVLLSAPSLGEVEIENYAEFETKFDKAFASLKNGEKISVSYESKEGFNKLEDGEIVDSVYGTYENDLDLETITIGEDVTVITLADETKEAKLPISNGKFITVKVGDVKLDTEKPKFKVVDGNYVDKDGNAIKVFDGAKVLDSDVIDELIVLGGVVEGYYPDTTGAEEADPDKGVYAIVKSAQAVTKEELTVSDLYDASITRLTVKGNEIRKAMMDILNDEFNDENQDNAKFNIIVTNNAGKEVFNASSETDEDSDAANDNIVSELQTTIENKNVQSIKLVFSTIDDETDPKLEWTPVYEATITQARGESYANLIDAIYDGGAVNTLAGLDRYKTAVEVSKATYEDANDLTEDTVVLVSGDASKLVDGLTATPLAAILDAPVLLTQSNSINKDTLNEIKRLEAQNVIIVGGTSSINESVANELKTVHGLNVTRLGGDSRYETSMAVANKIAAEKAEEKTATTAGFSEVFVVGGNGEADALSVSAIAAEKEAPILLTPADKLDTEVKYYINKNVTDSNTDTDVYVVGGTNSVNASVQAELVKINVNNKLNNNIEVKRLAGLTRQDTNAAVITEFADVEHGLKNIVVAKSDNKGMVDALAAGVYAAKNNSHIVLATNELTEAQEDAISEVKKVNATDTLVQAGYNVAKGVVAKLKQLIR